MKKLMIFVLILLLLTSCSKINSDDIKNINVVFDEINEIRIHTYINGITIEPNVEWIEFVETVNILDYESLSKTEFEEIMDNIEDYFVITLVYEEGYRFFFVYENNLITYYLDNINDKLDDVELLKTSHDDIGILFFELNEIDFPKNSILIKKPVIYIYPEAITEVDIAIESECIITTSYPTYNDGWNVLVEPSGLITDKNGKKYSYLYWEGKITFEHEIENGFVVKREDSIAFLEEKLALMGLNYEESNDFITYWLPELEKNKYNKIKFLTEEYENIVKLNIRPNPDTVIRVFMVFKGLEEREYVEKQVITPAQRKGYTVIEWGGAELK